MRGILIALLLAACGDNLAATPSVVEAECGSPPDAPAYASSTGADGNIEIPASQFAALQQWQADIGAWEICALEAGS